MTRPAPRSVRSARALCAVIAASAGLLAFAPTTRAGDQDQPLRVVIVGGGPSLQSNQVAIESNVRYVTRLLPQGTSHTTLFADGDPTHATVLYDAEQPDAKPGERLFALAMNGSDDSADTGRYRAPQIGKVSGASRPSDIQRVFADLRREEQAQSTPVLLYFTGHGSPDRDDRNNNEYDLWGGQGLTVRDLAGDLNGLPPGVPVTLVMVQCFSGAFGNLLFQAGDPNGPLDGRDIAGYFATVKERVAAGCTSAVNEAEYHDFTSYFFAALTGVDRVGRPVSGADYNGDGRVGMDEAYCYTLIHDDSIDVPVCTSDVFLRRFVAGSDREIFDTPYSRVMEWASPAQRAALQALSARLHLDSDLSQAYTKMVRNIGETDASTPPRRHLNELRKEARRTLLRRWPLLAAPDNPGYAEQKRQATGYLAAQSDMELWKALAAADDDLNRYYGAHEAREIADSQLLRFVRLAKSVVLAHRLNIGTDSTLKKRFARLVLAEGRTILPPAAPSSAAVAQAESGTVSRSLPQLSCGTGDAMASH